VIVGQIQKHRGFLYAHRCSSQAKYKLAAQRVLEYGWGGEEREVTMCVLDMYFDLIVYGSLDQMDWTWHAHKSGFRD
jgi:hypothetical protein